MGELYCLRVTHPVHEGWWAVDPTQYSGEQIDLGWGISIAQHAAGVCAWEEPKLTEIQKDLLDDGYDSTRIPLAAAQQYMGE